jgi:hypothetical protein
MTKNCTKFTAEKNLIFLDHELQFTYPYASIKDVQVTEEAFALLDPEPESEYGSGSTDLIESGSSTDPDPKHWFKHIFL